jgi:peptidoglycan/xylan/chitin deacetylase (PgdA/CDA1 family)
MKKRKPVRALKITLIVLAAVIILGLAFFLYALWWPSSEVFWKTTYRTSDGSVLLTFDDGPGPETPSILDALVLNRETAVFFVNCDHIGPGEDAVLRRMVREGDTVGLHGERHVANEDYASLKECKEYIENITRVPVKYYRPPYGFKAPRTMKAAHSLNLTVVLWSVFPRDYRAKSASVIVSRVERRVFPGAIICMHDGSENRERTAEALQGIIDYMKEKGYSIGNIPGKQ